MISAMALWMGRRIPEAACSPQRGAKNTQGIPMAGKWVLHSQNGAPGTQSAPAEQETKPSSSRGDAGPSLLSFIKETSPEVAGISFCLQLPSAEFAVRAPSALQPAEQNWPELFRA